MRRVFARGLLGVMPFADSSAGINRSAWIRTLMIFEKLHTLLKEAGSAGLSTAWSSARCPAGRPAIITITTSHTVPNLDRLHQCGERGRGDQLRFITIPSHSFPEGARHAARSFSS